MKAIETDPIKHKRRNFSRFLSKIKNKITDGKIPCAALFGALGCRNQGVPLVALTAQTVVLLSGGIDSSSVLAYYLENSERQQSTVSALFFDYGQPSLSSEWAAAQAIAHHYQVSLRKERLTLGLVKRRGEYFGRNALFALAAAAQVGWKPVVIALGIHVGDYYDTTPAFLADVQRILDGYTAGTSLIIAPFAKYTTPRPSLCAGHKSTRCR